MIKYKNIILALLCVTAGAAVGVSSIHNTKVSTRISKIENLKSAIVYNIGKNKTKLFSLDANIKNLNFSLNENNNKLNKIAFISEESVYGFKNMYSLATVPTKIRRIKAQNRKIILNRLKMIEKITNDIKNLKSSFVYNELASYSNYNSLSKAKLFSSLSVSRDLNSSNGHKQIKEVIRADWNSLKNKVFNPIGKFFSNSDNIIGLLGVGLMSAVFFGAFIFAVNNKRANSKKSVNDVSKDTSTAAKYENVILNNEAKKEGVTVLNTNESVITSTMKIEAKESEELVKIVDEFI